MGGGSTGLLWYVLCFATIVFITTIGVGLFWWGERQKKKRRLARQAKRKAQGPTASEG